MTSAFGFILLLVKCILSRSVSGISLISMECYAVVYFLRLISINSTLAYLPSDKYICFLSITSRSGDWLYNLVNWICLVVIVVIIYLIMFPCKYSHNSHQVPCSYYHSFYD